MPSSILAIFVILLGSAMSFEPARLKLFGEAKAEEHGGGGSPGGHGGGEGAAPSAGGHEGGAPGAVVAPPTMESGHQSMEWVDLVNKVSAAKSKVEAQRSTVLSLIEQKNSIEKQEALNKHIETLVEENKKLNKFIDEYEAQKNLLQYRFPEKGITELRKYERVEKKSIEEFENEISIEGNLKKTLVKMKRQFKAPGLTEEQKKKAAEKEAAEKKARERAEAKAKAQEGPEVKTPDSVTDSIKIIK